MPEPILIRCPHCNHALSLPDEYLGQVVSCLECHAPFRAPAREGGQLTAPQPLPKPTRIPARVFVPTFGLLLMGFAGLFVNLYLAWWFGIDPKAAAQFAEANMFFMLDPDAPPAKDGKTRTADEEKKRRDEQAEKQQRLVKDAAGKVSPEGMRKVRLAFALVSLGVVAGGFCFALRRGYYYCYFACLLSALNSPDIGCCFIGVVLGVWGFMVLISDDGQRYFRRAQANGTA